MKKIILALGALALSNLSAHAGGIDRSRLAYSALYEKGKYIEFSYSRVSPNVKGRYQPALGGGSTGDLAGNYSTFSFAYKQDINEKLSFGLFYNTPYGADAFYSQGAYNMLQAEWNSKQAAVVLRYRVTDNVSVLGGVRVLKSDANITIPDTLIRGSLRAAAAAGSASAGFIVNNSPAGTLTYRASADNDTQVGYILGAAYEKPEIALRVSLTFESKITHSFGTNENIASPVFRFGALAAAFGPSVTDIQMPQTLTLDVQTGIAKDTLLFGSIRWANWSSWAVRPRGFAALTNGSNITDFRDDAYTFQIGIGRKLNDNLSVFARASYESDDNQVASRLSPTDGNYSFGIGAIYRNKSGVKITGGVEYVKLGSTFDASNTRFTSNEAIGFGVSVGYSF